MKQNTNKKITLKRTFCPRNLVFALVQDIQVPVIVHNIHRLPILASRRESRILQLATFFLFKGCFHWKGSRCTDFSSVLWSMNKSVDFFVDLPSWRAFIGIWRLRPPNTMTTWRLYLWGFILRCWTSAIGPRRPQLSLRPSLYIGSISVWGIILQVNERRSILKSNSK